MPRRLSPTDPQRESVYAWGHALAARYPTLSAPLTPAACRVLIARIWADYRGSDDVPPTLRNAGRNQYAYGKRWEISLPIAARNLIYLLHEIAHALRDMGQGYDNEPEHSPYFVRVYLDLLTHYGGVVESKAVAMAYDDRYAVRIARKAAVGKLCRRKSVAWVEWQERVKKARGRVREAETALHALLKEEPKP